MSKPTVFDRLKPWLFSTASFAVPLALGVIQETSKIPVLFFYTSIATIKGVSFGSSWSETVHVSYCWFLLGAIDRAAVEGPK